MGVKLLVEGIVEVVDHATQETFSDEPRGPNEIPHFFHLFPCMHRGGVVGYWFIGDNVRCNTGEIVVFVDTHDIGK